MNCMYFKKLPKLPARCGTLAVALSMAATLFSAGCTDRGADPVAPGPVPPSISYARDIQPIWDNNCAGCHGAGGQGNLDLRPGFGLANLVEVDAQGYAGKRVVSGDSDASVLYGKMVGAGGFGDIMPPGGSLPTAQLNKIRDWIEEGALDN